LLQQNGSKLQTQFWQAALSAHPALPVCEQHELTGPPVGRQVSVVQALLSLHSGAMAHPVAGSHDSVVQVFPSSQVVGGF
jgi:hypothetical protein